MASPEPTDEQLARLVVRVLAAALALLLAGGVASAAVRLNEADSDETAADVLVGAGDLSPRGGIGPLPGTSVPPYERARAEALAEVPTDGRRSAIVSFGEYQLVDAALEATSGLERRSLLVALPGGRPLEVAVHADLAGVVRRQREEAAAEQRALQDLLPTVTDDDFRRQYEKDIERLAAFLAGPVEVGPIVHGVLVVGTGDALRRTARVPSVRLVDPGRDDAVPGVGQATALRPEETELAGEPATRPR